MVASAVAGALGGLSAGNIGAAASGAMAPYIANEIKQKTTTYNADGTKDVNVVANTMAHAVAGAVLAQLAGNSAAAGAAGAASGELIARAIVSSMYPDVKDPNKLTESQKQTVSALSQIAAGLAGGMAADSGLGVGAGAVAGKNAVENNSLSGMDGFGTGFLNNVQAQGSLVNNTNLTDENGKVLNLATPEQIKYASDKLVMGELPDGANITKVIVDGYKDGVLIAGAAYLGPAASVGKVLSGAVIAEMANGTYQWFDINSDKNQTLPENQQKTWDYWGSASAAVTGALAPGRGILPNVGIATGGTVFTDGPNAGSVSGAVAGGLIGGGHWEICT